MIKKSTQKRPEEVIVVSDEDSWETPELSSHSIYPSNNNHFGTHLAIGGGIEIFIFDSSKYSRRFCGWWFDFYEDCAEYIKMAGKRPMGSTPTTEAIDQVVQYLRKRYSYLNQRKLKI